MLSQSECTVKFKEPTVFMVYIKLGLVEEMCVFAFIRNQIYNLCLMGNKTLPWTLTEVQNIMEQRFKADVKPRR